MTAIQKRQYNERPCILFVDDEERILRAVRALFRDKYEVLTTTDARTAIDHLKQRIVRVIITDYRMPGVNGVELLREAKKVSPHTTRLVLTGYADLNVAVGSINDGEVFQFISKPWDQSVLERTIAEAVEVSRRSGNERKLSLPAILSDATGNEAVVLTVSRSKRFYNAIAELEKDMCEVAYAETILEANLILHTKKVAVIVAEANPGSDDVALFLTAIKQQHPHIATIFVTPAANTDGAINLINHAQLFRLLTMPVSADQLKASIDAALKHSRSVRNVPYDRDVSLEGT